MCVARELHIVKYIGERDVTDYVCAYVYVYIRI